MQGFGQATEQEIAVAAGFLADGLMEAPPPREARHEARPLPAFEAERHVAHATEQLGEPEVTVPYASISTLMFSAAAIEQRLRRGPERLTPNWHRLRAIRAAIRGELELMEGVLLTLAHPGGAPAPVPVRARAARRLR